MNSSDVIQIPSFLSSVLREELLAFEASAFQENPMNYAVRSVELPENLTEKLWQSLRARGVAAQSPGKFWMRVESDVGVQDENAFIHVDPQDETAVVVYVKNSLYKNAQEAGTAFWEHTTLRKRSLDRQNARDLFLYNNVLRPDGTNKERWTPWLEVPFEENRAIVFPTVFFHSAPHPDSGKHAGGKRITLSLFLKSG